MVAAGGLADREDIARVVNWGASGAMLGTRFLASIECPAHDAYKRALMVAGENDTVLTNCFDGGWPYAQHRVLRNSTLIDWESAGCPPHGSRPGEGDVIATLESGRTVRRYDDMPPTSTMRGDVLSCSLYAGAGVAKINDIQPAARIVEDLWGNC